MLVYINTLGCRLNQSESERIAHSLRLLGAEITPNRDAADLLIINSCSVTTRAGKDSVRAAHKKKQILVVTGCHSEVAPEQFAEADLIVPSADKADLVEIIVDQMGLEELTIDGNHFGAEMDKEGMLPIYPLTLRNTRAFVKIQDGCSLSCTYCMTTIARGAPSSRPLSDIVLEVQTLASGGCQEVVLTGVHAASYGREASGQPDLEDLLKALISDTDIPRIRLSSIEPWNFDKEWFTLWTLYPGRLCRHFHMSLQSGSDTVLQRMKRAYDTDKFAAKIGEARDLIPNLALTTDLITGFPGETEEEHRQTLDFVKKMKFSGAHIFSFSSRPGTAAASMNGHLTQMKKKRRRQEIKEITDARSEDFIRQQSGVPQNVLWLQHDRRGDLEGLSDNYLSVICGPDVAKRRGWEPNTLHTVQLKLGRVRDKLTLEPQ